LMLFMRAAPSAPGRVARMNNEKMGLEGQYIRNERRF